MEIYKSGEKAVHNTYAQDILAKNIFSFNINDMNATTFFEFSWIQEIVARI